MTGTEIMLKNSNWKIPKLEKGNLIRFIYWNSELNSWNGYKGYIVNIRYLSSKPLKSDSRRNKIRRGNVQYLVSTSHGIFSFYNQRMSNVEKIAWQIKKMGYNSSISELTELDNGPDCKSGGKALRGSIPLARNNADF